MDDRIKTKQKVIEAAISLFNVQGFTGTSVREIAKRANVNAALVSYYFGSKKGLLEQLMTKFLEGYVHVIEQAIERSKHDQLSSKECLLHAIENILIYQQENHNLARFIHREITLDTVLVRELMTTYLMKEKHLFHVIIEKGMAEEEFNRQPIDFIVMQLRGMLIMPYLHPQYIREVYHLIPHERFFLEKYMDYLTRWVEDYICNEQSSSLYSSRKMLLIRP
ncbi:forespore capture DNA-binding protein RefZ [Desertibacillus haloalkaliphilus]|uniref:forespore capture DNA-binding protein RefZ n=1 Tax=Desertibacillus haloalkaliphilus TaxID=1328930 RepID=UPI001C25CE4F|nr:forespore capture DNA-binding protein RefZ [Desertibacillus haloalkaliphilus]MBU8905203.1 forespore capture DNA-binding protein RefZ [Desertibacillus haloalkaliphilus]